MKTTLLAFHSNPKVKAKYLRRVRAHAKADEIISGTYWEGGMGCAVGCTLHSSSHKAYETELGIPQVLARLEDRLFERMYSEYPTEAKAWPERFLLAAKPGADLSMVWPKFAHWMLVDAKHGVIRFAKTDRSKTAINNVAALYLRWINGDKPAAKEWTAYATPAAAAARWVRCQSFAAAAYAADAADAAYAADADADAAYAADADADAAYAAADAAYAAAAAAYAAAAARQKARSEHCVTMANKLAQLMGEAT